MPHGQPAGHLPWVEQLYDGEEGNTMTPGYTLLLCLPAALVLLACACGLAVLGPCAARPTAHSTPHRRPATWPEPSRRKPRGPVETEGRR